MGYFSDCVTACLGHHEAAEEASASPWAAKYGECAVDHARLRVAEGEAVPSASQADAERQLSDRVEAWDLLHVGNPIKLCEIPWSEFMDFWPTLKVPLPKPLFGRIPFSC